VTEPKSPIFRAEWNIVYFFIIFGVIMVEFYGWHLNLIFIMAREVVMERLLRS
jgi:hypothetical protein